MIGLHAVSKRRSFAFVRPQPPLILGTLVFAFVLMCVQVLLQLRGTADFLTDMIGLGILTGVLAFAQVLDRRTGIIGAALAGAVAAIVPGVPTIPPHVSWEIVLRPTSFIMMGIVYYIVIIALRTRDEHVTRQLADLRALHAEVRALHALTDRTPIDPTVIQTQIVEAATRLGGAWRSQLVLFDAQEGARAIAVWPATAASAAPPFQSHTPVAKDTPYIVTPRPGGGSVITIALTGEHGTVGALEVEYKGTEAVGSDSADLLAIYAGDAGLTLEHVTLRERLDRLLLREERARIARELHDGLVQSLGGVGYRLEYVRRTLTADSVEDVRRELAMTEGEIRAALHEAREMIYGLRHPSSGEDTAARLRALLDAVADDSGLIVSADLPHTPPLPSAHAEVIVAVAREALQNVIKHAQAEAVSLALLAGPGYVELTVSDDGCGFRFEETGERDDSLRYGLLGMVERAERQGGSVSIQTAPGMGATVTLTLPMEGTDG